MQFLNEKNRVIFLALLYCLSFFYLISSVQRFFLENDPGISLYFQYANQVFSHKIPYYDFMFEYPPFSLLFMLLPRVLGSCYSEYGLIFLLMIAIAGLLGLFITADIVKNRKGRFFAPISYILLFIAVGPLTFFRYDLLPAIMTLLAIWLWINRHKKSAWFVIGLAVATKIYPLVIMPFFLVDDFKNVKQKIYDFSFFLLAIAISILPFIAHLNDLKKFIAYHSARGIQIESLWANFLMIEHLIDRSVLRVISEAGTFGVSPFPKIFIPLSLIIFFVGFLLIFLSYLKKKKKIILHSFLAVLLFILANKVFSPQYMIWLVVLFQNVVILSL